MTDDRIEELAQLNLGYDRSVRLRDFARAIEREVLVTWPAAEPAAAAKPIGYVTQYALDSVLARGGHIPMHPEPICSVTVPVYLAAHTPDRPVDPDDIDAVTEAITREINVKWEIAQRAAVAAIDTLIALGNHGAPSTPAPVAIYQVYMGLSGWRDVDRIRYEESPGKRRIVYADPAQPTETPHGNR